MAARKTLLLTLLLLFSNVPMARAQAPISASASPGPNGGAPFANLDGEIKKRIDFWISIYTQYTTSEGVIHDAKYPYLVYEKIDFRSDEEDYNVPEKTKRKQRQRKLNDIKAFYQKVLLSIHKKQKSKEPLSPAETRVAELYKDINEPNKFFSAAHNKRVRFQLGQKDRYLQGLFYSGRYLSLMEKIFRDHGVPVEITRLPFVESSFNLKARSKVGASGIFQFMRSTGKLYLKINDTIDERNDPIRAAEAAANLLMQNYESLGSWPLAITAYNHGRKGLMRAVRKVGSDDLLEIIDEYRSRSFGFASSNFFAEFMAAYLVERDAEKYFGKVERDRPVEFSEFIMTDYVNILDLSTYTRVPIDTLAELNPGLTDSVIKGKRYIPAGFVLRIPTEMKDKFLARYNEIPPSKRHAAQPGLRVTSAN